MASFRGRLAPLSVLSLLVLLFSSYYSLGDEKYQKSDLERLEEVIDKIHQKKLLNAPKEVIEEIKSQENIDYAHKLSESSQLWLHQNFSQIENNDDIQVALKFEILKMPDSVSQILTQTFWCKIHGKPYSLNDKIKVITNYWKEKEEPNIKSSPLGEGKIDWFWQLDSHERPDGILHVGIDTKTRMFLCYEINKGLYFPSGMLLERIRAEIVQNEILAGDRLGKGFINKTSNEK